VAFSGRCGPPQQFLLIHKGLLAASNKPFFFLGKTWERNQCSLINLRPSSPEQFAKFLGRVPFIIGDGCNRPSHYFRCGPDAACESAVGCQENPSLLPPCDENCAVLVTPHVSRSALSVQWVSPSPQTSLVAWYQSSECRDDQASC
jgi:hypothetical protein